MPWHRGWGKLGEMKGPTRIANAPPGSRMRSDLPRKAEEVEVSMNRKRTWRRSAMKNAVRD